MALQAVPVGGVVAAARLAQQRTDDARACAGDHAELLPTLTLAASPNPNLNLALTLYNLKP